MNESVQHIGLIKVWVLLCALLVAFIGGCSQLSMTFPQDVRPALSYSDDQVAKHYYDGVSDDLATAGLGLKGLQAKAPLFLDPNSPSRRELRRSAFYYNINHLIALQVGSGVGALYGRYLSSSDGEWRVPGHELIVPLRYPDGQVATMILLQVPDDFDWQNPCLVVGAASGSRGLYGAAGAVGLWALSKGCAVTVTDKGTGPAYHWLTENFAVNVDGTIQPPNPQSHFYQSDVDDFARKYPYRVATKHAHNNKQEDQYWGDFVLAAIDTAFALLNSEFPLSPGLSPKNTMVIGAAISNGGGAVVKAAERDTRERFDGIVVSEPNIPLPEGFDYQWELDGRRQSYRTDSQMRVAYAQALYLPCAARFHDESDLPEDVKAAWLPTFARRCQDLHGYGLLKASTLLEQSAEALQKLQEKGYSTNANPLALMLARNISWNASVLNYTYAIGGFAIEDHLCGLSYAYVDDQGRPTVMPQALKNRVFSQSSGALPSVGITLVNDENPGGPRSLLASNMVNGTSDLGFKSLLCLADYVTSSRVSQGLDTLAVSGDLKGLPAIIVHGEADNIVQVKNTSRPYFVLNASTETQPNLHYYEVNHAQHMDFMVAVPAVRKYFVPLQHYFESALNIMFQHLRHGEAIPSSRLVLAEPVRNVNDAITREQLPEILSNKTRLISVDDGVLVFSD